MDKHMISTGLAVSLVAAANAWADQDDGFANHSTGAVYTMDNAVGGNHVWAFPRNHDGSLLSPTAYATHGLGTGGSLSSQGSVALSRDGHWLFVCNPGSDEISLLGVTPRGLVLTDTVPSSGHLPVSLTVHGNLLYVLNAGGETGEQDNLAGFVFAGGKLWHLPGATYSLSSSNTAPAEVAFTLDGEHLVVTEKGPGIIDTYAVENEGYVEDHKTFISPNPPPYGFAVGRQDRIFVTQAAGGASATGASSVSSYEVGEWGNLEVISGSVATHQTAACWMAISPDQHFAYSANTPNASISSFQVAPSGSLTLLQSQAATTGANGPADMAFSADGNYLYSLEPGNGAIGAFSVNPGTGALIPLTPAESLPTSVNGLAAW
jgi:6-phosphogluconolactonase (cycloisomerase 2 family)